jgi:hypothetical protein
MGANTDLLRTSGEQLKGIAGAELAAPPQLEPGPLGAGLVGAQNAKSQGAVAFGNTVRRGVDAAGRGLVHLADGMTSVDAMTADSIARLFPDAPPRIDGGR